MSREQIEQELLSRYERPGDADGNPELGVDPIEDLIQSNRVSPREKDALIDLRNERDEYHRVSSNLADRYGEALKQIASWRSRFAEAERPGDVDGDPELGVDPIEDLIQSDRLSPREKEALVQLRDERDEYHRVASNLAGENDELRVRCSGLTVDLSVALRERSRYKRALEQIAVWDSRFADGVQGIARRALEGE